MKYTYSGTWIQEIHRNIKNSDTWNTVRHGYKICMDTRYAWIQDMHGYKKCMDTKNNNLLFSTLIHDVRRETKVIIVRTKFSFISQYSTPVLHSIHPTLVSFSSYPSYLFYIPSILPLLPSHPILPTYSTFHNLILSSFSSYPSYLIYIPTHLTLPSFPS